MRIRTRLRLLVGGLVLGCSFASSRVTAAQGPEGSCPECDRVVRRVEQLLARRPERVVVIDASRQSPAFQLRVAHAEAFVIAGENAVYLKKQGPTFQRALGGQGIWDYALAVIVCHEMAHLAGADEREAQRQEELLWQQFVLGGRVDARRGLQYARLLQNRKKHTVQWEAP